MWFVKLKEYYEFEESPMALRVPLLSVYRHLSDLIFQVRDMAVLIAFIYCAFVVWNDCCKWQHT